MPSGPTPPIYINGVQCSYYAPEGRFAIKESAGPEGPVTTLVYKVDWADRWNLIQQLMPTCVIDESEAGFTRTPPFALPPPYSTNPNSNQVCTSVGDFIYLGNGWDPSTGEHEGQYVAVPATFSCVPWQFVDGNPAGQNDPSGQAWTVTKIKPSCEVFQPTGGSYWLGAFPSTTPLDEASVGFLRANCEITVVRKFLPFLPLANLVQVDVDDNPNPGLGSANATDMGFADTIFDPGTLLLVGSEFSDPYFDCIGNQVCDWTQVYLGRVGATWNQVQDRAGDWVEVNSSADGSGDAPFDLCDFTAFPR